MKMKIRVFFLKKVDYVYLKVKGKIYIESNFSKIQLQSGITKN